MQSALKVIWGLCFWTESMTWIWRARRFCFRCCQMEMPVKAAATACALSRALPGIWTRRSSLDVFAENFTFVSAESAFACRCCAKGPWRAPRDPEDRSHVAWGRAVSFIESGRPKGFATRGAGVDSEGARTHALESEASGAGTPDQLQVSPLQD